MYKITILCVTLISVLSAQAQNRFYLDAQLGAEFPFVEDAFWGAGKWPLNARVTKWHEIIAPALRWQGQNWSVSAGYSGCNYAWAYNLRLPVSLVQNPYRQRLFRGGISSAHGHRIPVLVSRRLTDVNVWPLTEDTYLLSFRVEGILGGGLQAKSYTCLDCGNLSVGGNGYDTIRFDERPYWRRRWGGYITAGATARFYRRGKERLTLRLLVTQGLQDMIVVPLDYSYNGRRGSTTLRVRGSGVSLTLGYPFKLHTFRGGRPE